MNPVHLHGEPDGVSKGTIQANSIKRVPFVNMKYQNCEHKGGLEVSYTVEGSTNHESATESSTSRQYKSFKPRHSEVD